MTTTSFQIRKQAAYTQGDVSGNLDVGGNTIASNLPGSVRTVTLIGVAGTTNLFAGTQFRMDTAAGTQTLLLPPPVQSTRGDNIEIVFSAPAANGATKRIQTSVLAADGVTRTNTGAADFALTSYILRSPGINGTAQTNVSVLVPAAAGESTINIVGLTNAGAGNGTQILCTFNGVSWDARVKEAEQGTSAVVSTTDFAA